LFLQKPKKKKKKKKKKLCNYMVSKMATSTDFWSAADDAVNSFWTTCYYMPYLIPCLPAKMLSLIN
jgi:transcription antitermination factor NusG